MCLYLWISLSNVNIIAGNTVIVHITPNTTPLAITNPMSFPKPNSIMHNARNPATVVKELPAIDAIVFSIATAIASVLSGWLLHSSSYLFSKKIE